MNLIESYFEGRPKRFDDYITDIKTKRAVKETLKLLGRQLTEF